MKFSKWRMLALVCAAVLAACESQRSVQVHSLATPTSADSFAPRLTNANGELVLSWLEADADGHRLRFARWLGAGWSAPRTVAGGAHWFANWADVPGVRALASGDWLAWWLQKSGGDAYAYDIQLALSPDGVEWKPLGSPHDDATRTEHGFVSAFDDAQGFGLVWLDGRNTAAAADHAHQGAMTLRHARFDAQGARLEDTELDGRVCDCCQTDAAPFADGAVVVYRDRDMNETRDISLVQLVDGAWRAPLPVHADGWRIDGCPVNGPAVAAGDNRIAVAWFTAPDGEPQVRAAMSKDGGAHFASPVRIDAGQPLGRTDVVMHPVYGALVIWLEQRQGKAQVRLRGVDGEWPEEGILLVEVAATRASGFPQLAHLDDGGLLLAWTESGEGKRRVQSALVTLPR